MNSRVRQSDAVLGAASIDDSYQDDNAAFVRAIALARIEGSSSSTLAIASRLRARQMSTQDAIAAIVVRVSAIAPDPLRPALRQLLASLVKHDPTLQQLCRDFERAAS